MSLKRIINIILFLFLFILSSLGNETKNTHIIKIRVSYLDLNIDSIYRRIDPIANTSTEAVYLKKMLFLAKNKKKDSLRGQILYLISRNYFNRSNYDSLKYWVDRTTNFSIKKKLYNNYFDACNLLCSWDIYDMNFERALDSASQLYYFAKKINCNYGLVSSYENIGSIYMETFRYKEAIKYFNDGISLLDKEKNKQYSYLIQLLSYVVECNLKAKDYKHASIAIDSMQRNLEEWNKKENFVPYNRCMWLLLSYKIQMYVDLKDSTKAKQCIDQVKLFNKNVKDNYVSAYSAMALASYYDYVKDYDIAFEYLNNNSTYDYSLPIVRMKANILLKSKKYKESAELFNNFVNSLDSTYNQDFAKQLNQLRNTHEVDKLRIKNNELELKSREESLKIILSIALLLLIITIVSILYLLWMKKMRNRLIISQDLLIKEKKELENSKKELIIAKESAEASNKFKDTFLANMSHEVRTPLNAIVGFSSVISDMYNDNEETREYSSLIRQNSDLLLKLINDTIDISLLQNNQIEFEYEKCELNGFCISLIDELKSKKKNNVDIIFSPKTDKIIYFRTDLRRIHQLLMNLLLNSLKFTYNGYIKLDYKIEKHSIFFIVEDTGNGISADMQTKVFESFQKANSFTQGIGLGLSLSKIISDKLNGKLILDTTYNNGTRMIFIHPIT